MDHIKEAGEQEREAFEKWARDKDYDLARDTLGWTFADAETETAWCGFQVGWQARSLLSPSPAPGMKGWIATANRKPNVIYDKTGGTNSVLAWFKNPAEGCVPSQVCNTEYFHAHANIFSHWQYIDAPTVPAAPTAQADLHAAIMNLPCNVPSGYPFGSELCEGVYRQGHDAACRAAAALVSAARSSPPPQVELTDEEIIAIANRTRTAETGDAGYVLPISFARAILAAYREKLG